MPKPISRVGDSNIVGGKLTVGAKSVIASGMPVALNPNVVTPHPSGFHHKAAKTIVGLNDFTVLVEGRPVVRLGTKTTCGHPIVTGAITVLVP